MSNSFLNLILGPFFEFEFLRNALFCLIFSALIGPPLGIFLIQKRLTLVGDSLSHAMLPGIAIAFYVSGTGSSVALMMGALIAGLTVVYLAHYITEKLKVFEEASFAGFYLLALALGIVFLSKNGSSQDLMHILFGQPLAASREQLEISFWFTLGALMLLILGYRVLTLQTMDPSFLKVNGVSPSLIHWLFMTLFVLYLVVNFKISGTLLSIGQMLLPALAAKIWTKSFYKSIILASVFGSLSALIGSLLSFHFDFPMSATVLICSGFFFLTGILISPYKGLVFQWLNLKHYKN